MKPCLMNITTSVDGNKSNISGKAEMELTPLSAILRYKENNYELKVLLNNKCITVDRIGDYNLHLKFLEGEKTEGLLSILGNNGNLEIETSKLNYIIRDNSLFISLKYSLIFQKENQNMEILIKSRYINNSEEK